MLRVALVVLALATADVAVAQEQNATLTATILGQDGSPRPGLAVQVLGPSTVVTATDSRGKFTVQLRAGTYVIRVSHGFRRAEFPQVVAVGDNEASYKVGW